MTVEEYNGYFEKFITTHKWIEKVYPIDLLDFETAANDVKKMDEDPILCLEDFTVGTIARNIDQVMDVYQGALVVLSKLSIRRSAEDEKTELLSKIFTIIQNIKKTMIADKCSSCTWISGLKAERFLVQKVGPVLDQRYGWRLQFEIHEPLI